jgi:hypothetical protein
MWLKDFTEHADCPGYRYVMEVVKKHIATLGKDEFDSQYLYFKDMDAHGDIPDEFWVHVENVLGRKIPERRRAKHFTCSC